MKNKTAAYPVKVISNESWSLITNPSGRLYFKMYDEYGGAGSIDAGLLTKLFYYRKIRNAIKHSHNQ